MRRARIGPRCASPWSRRTRGRTPGASRGTSRRWPSSFSPRATTSACSRRSTPDDRLVRACCTAARARSGARARYLIPLGRTIGFPANGAVSNLAHRPYAVSRCAASSRSGGFDVVHVHEPVVPVRRLGRAVASTRAAARRHVPLLLDEPRHATASRTRSARAGVLQPPARADRRLGGGGVDRRSASSAAATGSSPTASTLPDGRARRAASRARRPLRIAFVGQAVERKGLPVLLRAFEALREHVARSS